MLKRVRRRTPEKERVAHDLFSYFKTVDHGFPHKPNAVAHDPELRLLAIGTGTGKIKLFGQPGVELSAQHSYETCVQQLFFLPNQGRIISVCDDGELNTLHLWEINTRNHKSVLEEVKACTLEGRLKKISVCFLSMKRECLYIGTEGGHIYVLDISSFELKDHIIYQDIVMQSLPGNDSRTSGGSVEALKEHPNDASKLLIGYKKGIIVLWNQDKIRAEGTFTANQDLEGVCWHSTANHFISAHEHGSLSRWTLAESYRGDVVQETSTPFGPFPCKAIRKVIWHDPYILFSGGLPRANYGDRYCISLMHGSTVQFVFDFTSKVLDFFTILDPSQETDELVALAVLCEQEFVMIDLKNKEQGYPTYLKPYLACIHSSQITTSYHWAHCPKDVWERIHRAGESLYGEDYSNEPWPITGGISLVEDSGSCDLLITGHEDGSLRFWDVSLVSLRLIFMISTSKLFISDTDGEFGGDNADLDDDGWPPFKKVGSFDPYSDDPRFCIQKIALCPYTNVLAVGGSGGQVVMYALGPVDKRPEFKIHDINVVAKLDGFEWKGHGPLTLRDDAITDSNTVQALRVIQLRPSAPITALSLQSSWGLLAAGTCHGFTVYDYVSEKMALVKCTINPTDLANTGGSIQRRKTLVKSLRDSIRRLKRRSTKRRPKGDGSDVGSNNASAATSPQQARGTLGPSSMRLIDENKVDEAMLSMVRCLYFGDTFLSDGVHHGPTLWAGTNAGYIYVYSVHVPGKNDRREDDIQAEIGKEIKLRHHAPVVSIFIVDKHGDPLPERYEVDAGLEKDADMTGQHSVVICSEEQFKVFSLPTLRAKHKEKLTAIDGSKVRKIGLVEGKVKHDDEELTVHCMACLNNQGEVSVYSIPSLKLQTKSNAIKKEDISAMQSMVFTRSGQGFYLRSPSELQRFSMAVNNAITPDCLVEFAEGMRPAYGSCDGLAGQSPVSDHSNHNSPSHGTHHMSHNREERSPLLNHQHNNRHDSNSVVVSQTTRTTKTMHITTTSHSTNATAVH